MLNASAVNIKVKNVPVIISNKKSQISLDWKRPYNANGIPRPIIKLIDRDKATPKYCPIKIDDRRIGCARRSSVNSLEL